MKKILVLLVALTVAVAFSAVTFAEEAKKAEPAKAAAPAKTAEPAKAEAVKTGKGTVTAVDANAKTITVKTKKGEKVIAITDASKIAVGKDIKALADVKVGDQVRVTVVKAAKKSEKNPCAKNPCAKK